MPADAALPKARQGFALFNQGAFHPAHERLEEAWQESPSPERDLYQGILQIGLAYYQVSQGNYRGALKMFQRGDRNLAQLGDSLGGIDLNQFRQDYQEIEAQVRRLGPARYSTLDPAGFKPIPIKD